MPLDGSSQQYETAQVLRDAAAYIQKHGWCQHVLTQNGGAVCPRGALMAATGCEPGGWFRQAEDSISGQADKALNKYLGLGICGNVGSWNNYSHRTKDEVIAALNGAADMSEGITQEVVSCK